MPVQPPEAFPVINMCSPDPTTPVGGALTCPANLADIANWFPTTPPMQTGGGCKPLPHPARECRFYQESWQEFLIATQPDATTGRVALLDWNTIENTFGAGAGKPTPAVPVFLAGVTQAGGRQVVIDQNGNALYYAIHMNPAFVKFVNDSHLTSADQITRAANLNIKFTTTSAIVETKEAWQVIPDTLPAAQRQVIQNTFITTPAMVPTLTVDGTGVVAHDDMLRMVNLALVAIHIVHTIPDHSEFIWSSFQHANRQTGVTDLAPSLSDLPTVPGVTIVPNINHILFAVNTARAAANQGILVPALNVATQTFTTPPTSIYRVFPGSKSRDPAIDDDVAATNLSFTTRFAGNPRPGPLDRRPFYRLLGAIWQDLPGTTFTKNRSLVNDPTDPMIMALGSDAPNTITGGEDRISSVAMESFTQAENSFPNCFDCHDTRSTAGNGVPQVRAMAAPAVMQPGLINVSHIFNEVVRLNIN